MPITYQIDPERNLVTVSAHGVLKEHEYRETRAELASDSRFHSGMKVLEDFRSVEKHAFTTESYKRFIEQEILLQPIFGNGRHAIVTHSDLHYGLTRQLIGEMGTSSQEAQAFRDMEEAETWLSNEDDQE
jgi:hypothetical protein